MEISITNKLKKIDSKLIIHLISIPNINNTITINPNYLDVFNIIKKNKTIYVDFKDVNRVNHIIEGLLYFDNNKILENIMIKLGNHIREKYIDRKRVERFFEKYIKRGVCIYWYFLCQNNNLTDSFFKKNTLFTSEYFYKNTGLSEKFFENKIVNLNSLCKNTNLSEKFFEKYISDGKVKVNWSYLCENTNLSEQFFEKYESLGVLDWESLCKNTNISEAFFEKYEPLGVLNSGFYVQTLICLIVSSKNIFLILMLE
jgi:hypothetical protein